MPGSRACRSPRRAGCHRSVRWPGSGYVAAPRGVAPRRSPDPTVVRPGARLRDRIRRAAPRTARHWGGSRGPFRGTGRRRRRAGSAASGRAARRPTPGRRWRGRRARSRRPGPSPRGGARASRSRGRRRRSPRRPVPADRGRCRAPRAGSPSPHSSRRRWAGSRSRLAMLTNTERVTADGAVRTASATIAWFFRDRPTDRTLIGAPTDAVGVVASAPSVATRIWASPDRAASLPASSSASPRSPEALVGSISSRAWRTRPISAVSLTTIRAVRSAVTMLTLPPAGRSRSASSEAVFAASSRFGATSVAAMLAEVSRTRTMSRASPAGRSRNGRAARNARITTRSSCRSRSRLRRSFCHGALASTSEIKRCPQQRGRDHSLVPAKLEQVHRDDRRDEQQAEQREW